LMVGTGRILVDTGIFIALFDERDDHHQSAKRIEKWLDSRSILLPWPILYETLNTRLVNRLKRDPASLAKFGAIARSTNTELLDDKPYREALWTFLDQSSFRTSLSLVDAVLCNIIKDVNVPVSAILTFNERDFCAVCQQNNIELASAL